MNKQLSQSDAVYFIERYIKVPDRHQSVTIPFKMTQLRRLWLSDFQNDINEVILAPRKSGKSTAICAFMIWKAITRSNQSLAIVTLNYQLSRYIFTVLTKQYNSLIPHAYGDLTYLPMVTDDKNFILRLTNGTSIEVTVPSNIVKNKKLYTHAIVEDFNWVDDISIEYLEKFLDYDNCSWITSQLS